MMTRLKTHCGRCSQCLDRRFGTLAAGMADVDPEEMYDTDLLTGARVEDVDRTMAEISMAEKNGVSHRALAARALAEALKREPE